MPDHYRFWAYHYEKAPKGQIFGDDGQPPSFKELAQSGWCDTPSKFGQSDAVAFDNDIKNTRVSHIPGPETTDNPERAAQDSAEAADANADMDRKIQRDENPTDEQAKELVEEGKDRKSDAHGKGKGDSNIGKDGVTTGQVPKGAPEAEKPKKAESAQAKSDAEIAKASSENPSDDPLGG